MLENHDGSSTPDAAWAIFVDFDGTITDLDTFDVLVNHFAGEAAWLKTEIGLNDGTVSLRDVLQRQASYVRGSFESVAELLRSEIRVDPSFVPFVAACRARNVAVTVVSSGIEPIIRGRLSEIGLGALPVVANDVVASPDGWTICYRDNAANGTDKAAIVRASRARGSHVVFIGDGRSDYDAALAADVRFAKRGRPLESYLHEHDVAFVPFSSFAEIQAALAAGLGSALRAL